MNHPIKRHSSYPQTGSTFRFWVWGLLLAIFWAFPANSHAAKKTLGTLRRWDFNSAKELEDFTPGGTLKNLNVADGKLQLMLEDEDGFLIAPPLDVPLDHCFIRIRMKCNKVGMTEVYWSTDGNKNFPWYQRHIKLTPGTSARPDDRTDDGFVIYELPIGTSSDTCKQLTGFRIDPFNDTQNAVIEIDYIELIRQPPVLDVNFTTTMHQVDLNSRVPMRFIIKQVAGINTHEKYKITLPQTPPEKITIPESRHFGTVSDIRFRKAGVNHLRATMHTATDKLLYDFETSVIVGKQERLPLIAGLRSDRLAVDFIPTPDSKHLAAARWHIVDETGNRQPAGWLLPLCQLTVQQPDGRMIRRQPIMKLVEHSKRAARLTGHSEDLAGWKINVELQIAQKNNLEYIEVEAILQPPADGKLLEFSGPVLRTGNGSQDPLDRFGIFGGIEFLEPGWRSSSEHAVGEDFADRWSPHPFKIALPMMAIEAQRVTTCLFWHPMQKWDGTAAMPTAIFASPNFIDSQPNHLMKLSVPSIPVWMEENESMARRPYHTRSGQQLKLQYALHADTNLPAAMASKRWYEIINIPAHPPQVHDDRTTYDLIARNFGETIYWPQENGWRPHWYKETESKFLGHFAGELIAHALETGNKQWIEKTGLDGRFIIDVVGTLNAMLNGGSRSHANYRLRDMRPDGTWPFFNTARSIEQSTKASRGRYDSFGDDGSTCLGVCLQSAYPIIKYALYSGEQKYVDASVKALETMTQFRVPRGAQTWELHKDIPDIRASALAVQAYLYGYRITGDRRWLEEASYWAYAGLPFIYSWHVPMEWTMGSMWATPDRITAHCQPIPFSEGFQNPQRQVTPFGTIPVMGPTWYAINWFGVIVQWCGLEWAYHVRNLVEEEPDPFLRYIADGVVASGLQQMFDKSPYTGLFPDVWDTFENRAHGPFISSYWPLRCLQAQDRIPRWTKSWTRVLRNDFPKAQWFISGWGQPVSLSRPTQTNPWTVKVRYLIGQDNELVVFGVQSPKNVRVDQTILPQQQPKALLKYPGWKYDHDRQALMIRFRHTNEVSEIRVDW